VAYPIGTCPIDARHASIDACGAMYSSDQTYTAICTTDFQSVVLSQPSDWKSVVVRVRFVTPRLKFFVREAAAVWVWAASTHHRAAAAATLWDRCAAWHESVWWARIGVVITGV
jgi:hypothetical protein